ncbi:unnamed protein product, partial [Sphagnum compactum]
VDGSVLLHTSLVQTLTACRRNPLLAAERDRVAALLKRWYVVSVLQHRPACTIFYFPPSSTQERASEAGQSSLDVAGHARWQPARAGGRCAALLSSASALRLPAPGARRRPSSAPSHRSERGGRETGTWRESIRAVGGGGPPTPATNAPEGCDEGLSVVGGWVAANVGRKLIVGAELGARLGQGASGRVFQAWRRSDGLPVAVKIMHQKLLADHDNRQALENEISILKELECDNIIKLYDTFEDRYNFYLVLELVTGGELFFRIEARQGYCELDGRELCRCILTALNYIHERGIVHRDIKPENLLMASKDDDVTVKLCDFGFSERVSGDSLTGSLGTPLYMAPEIWSGRNYGLAIDMWSFGCLAYIILCGYPPFYDTDLAVLYALVSRGELIFHEEFWGPVSAAAKDFVSRLLTVDPAQRMTAAQALQHPWVSMMSQPTLRSLVIDGSAVHYPSLPPASKKVIQIVSETTTTTSNNNIKQQQQPTTSNNNIKQQQQPTTTTNNNYTAASEKQSRSQSLTSLVVMALPSPSSCGTSPALVRFRIEMAKKSGSGRGGSR